MSLRSKEAYLRGMALELCPLRLPHGLGLCELLLKLSQTPALITEQPTQLLQCDLHVCQGFDVLIRLQTEKSLVKNFVKAGRAARSPAEALPASERAEASPGIAVPSCKSHMQ